MKALIPGFLTFVLVLSLAAQTTETFSSVDSTRGRKDETYPAGLLKFEDADLKQVLNIYREMSGRTVVYSTSLPHAKINLQSQTPLTRTEALQALDSVLAQNGIVMIPQGTKFVKAVPMQLAPVECPPLVNLPPDQLPESGSYICYMVELKNKKPRDVIHALQPLAKMPTSILAIDDGNLIVIRDFSGNVRRMLQLIEKLDKPAPKD